MEKDASNVENDMRDARARTKARIKAEAKKRSETLEEEPDEEATSVSPLQLPLDDEDVTDEPRSAGRRMSRTGMGSSSIILLIGYLC